jgi:hypothetical protein
MKTIRRVLFTLSVGTIVSSVVAVTRIASLPTAIIGIVIVGGVVVAIVSAVLEVRSWQLPTPEEPPMSPPVRQPLSTVEKAVQAMDEAKAVSTRTERKVRIRIEADDDTEQDD